MTEVERVKAFIDALEEKARFWRDTKMDPHGIACAVMVALQEVHDAAKNLYDPEP